MGVGIVAPGTNLLANIASESPVLHLSTKFLRKPVFPVLNSKVGNAT
jgi:hypothetical protein